MSKRVKVLTARGALIALLGKFEKHEAVLQELGVSKDELQKYIQASKPRGSHKGKG